MIHEKLFEIFKEVHSSPIVMESNGEYKFVSSTAIKRLVNPLLIKHRVMPTPTKVISVVRNGKVVDVTMEMGFYDLDDKNSYKMIVTGSGYDEKDKGVYKAMTGADKYKYILLFQIPTKDDPEYSGLTIDNPIVLQDNHNKKAVGRVQLEMESAIVNVPDVVAIKPEEVKESTDINIDDMSIPELKSAIGALGINVDNLKFFDSKPVLRMSKKNLSDILYAERRGELATFMKKHWGIEAGEDKVKKDAISPEPVNLSISTEMPEIEDLDAIFSARSFKNATEIEEYFLSKGYDDQKVVPALKEMDAFDYGDGEANVYLNLKDMCTCAPAELIQSMLNVLSV